MTKLLQMGDSSTPPVGRTELPVYAFYVWGETPHVWTPAEVHGLDSRWGLPIGVCIDPARNPEQDAADMALQLEKLGWSHGTAVALDTEDRVMGAYLTRFDHYIQQHGHTLVHYESESVQGENPPTTGGKWVARWPGEQDLPNGAVANQYMSATEAGTPWDCSVISSAVRLHELNRVVVPTFVDTSVVAIMPALRSGDRGYSVRALQALLAAALPDMAGQALSDGDFGPITEQAVIRWQHLYGVTDQRGVAGHGTWESLLTRS